MSLDVFQAVVNGYTDRLRDMQIMSAHTGYWSGYFNRTKKPKSLDSIIHSIVKGSRAKSKHVDSVDVAAFEARERAFMAQYNRKEVDNGY